MKRIIVALTLLLGVAGLNVSCTKQQMEVFQAIQGAAITQSMVDAARNTYDGAVLAPLDKYAALVRCRTGQSFSLAVPCHDRKALKDFRNADKAVATALENTQNRVATGDNKGAVAAYKTLQDALSIARAIAATTGASLL